MKPEEISFMAAWQARYHGKLWQIHARHETGGRLLTILLLYGVIAGAALGATNIAIIGCALILVITIGTLGTPDQTNHHTGMRRKFLDILSDATQEKTHETHKDLRNRLVDLLYQQAPTKALLMKITEQEIQGKPIEVPLWRRMLAPYLSQDDYARTHKTGPVV